jgi:hypothetical protein
VIFGFILRSHNGYMTVSEHRGEGCVLENGGAGGVSPLPVAVKPKSRKRLLIAVAALAVVAVVAGAFVASGLLSQPVGQGSWLFKGAYADYAGSTSLSVMGYSYRFDFSVKLEVLDYNSTHAYIKTSSTMSSSASPTITNENSTWVELSSFQFMNAFSGTNLTRSYEASVNVGNLGTRSCMVYEYATDGPSMTVYVDKAMQWPVKMTMSMSAEGLMSPLTLDITLEDTNIPGLR